VDGAGDASDWQMRREARSFVTLDGLRGIAAFAVMISHTGRFIGLEIPEAFLAVDFFFALSGFVLAHAYTERLRTGMSPRSFLMLRLVRLYPLYILGTAIGMLILPLTSHADGFSQLAIEIAAAVLFLPSPVTELLYPFNFPAWSLFHELLINGAFGALSNLLSRVVLCGIVAISAVILAGYAIWLGSLDTSNSWVYFEGGFVRVSFSFFAGVLVYRIWQKRPAPLNFPAALLSAILLALLSLPVPPHYAAVYHVSLVLLAFPLLLWLGASSTPIRPIASVCSWLGEISYAVYVLHVPMIIALRKLHTPLGPLWSLVVIVAAAHFATRFFDRPVRRWLVAWLGVAHDARPVRRMSGAP
jgi:peptidoglycan/LPS O-acetylase OafA/YrhL